jgi:GT2 family glycosyltransferase
VNYPLVSVITVNYNGKMLLKQCLPSLLQTDYPNYEIIVVDNGSSDGSVKFVKENFPTVKVIQLNKNYGYNGAANSGAKYAKGELLAILNNDITVERTWLKELVKVILEKPNAGSAAPKKLLMDQPQTLDGAGGRINVLLAGSDRGYLELDRGMYDKIEPIPYPPGAAYLITRKIASKCGYLLDPNFFMYFDDAEVGARLHLLGYTTYYVPSSVIYHKRGASRGHFNPRIHFLFHRNQLIYAYTLFGFAIFIKTVPILLLFNAITSFYYAFVNRDGRYIGSLFLQPLRFVIKFRSIELRRKQFQPLKKCTTQSYFEKFSGELSLPVKLNSATLNLLIALIRLVNKYFYYVKLGAPPITAIKVVKNPAEIEIYNI